MAVGKALCLSLMFCVIWRRASAIRTEITFSPESLVLDHDGAEQGDTVTVNCKAIDVQSADIVTMWITRTTVKYGEESLVTDAANLAELDVINKSGMTATGGISELMLTLTMPETKCADAGNYTCNIFVLGTPPSPYDSAKRLSVEVSPGPVTLTPTPKKESYTVNETLEMLCNGPVGTVNDDTQVSWVWRYKDTSLSVSNWQTVGENDGQIEDVGDPLEEECHEVRQSRLTRVLTLADSNRMYQCVVSHGNTLYTQFNGNYTIDSVTEEVATTTASTTGGGAQKSKVGGIVGGVVGALVAIIVVIIIVVVVMKRRKNSRGDDYATDDAANKPADDPNGAPFTTGPGVMYSAPKPYRNDREPQGVNNRGMDEATEKPSPRDNSAHPPRYANDFHQGRRNRGYSYDPDGRSGGGQRYSSDEDGTDSRVNTSQVSLGQGDPSIGTPI